MRRRSGPTACGRRHQLRVRLVGAATLLLLGSACAQAEDHAVERIPLALLMRTEHRSAEDLRRAAEAAAALGIEITAQGRASLSGRVSPADFERLFGTEATPLPAEPPGPRDAGRAGGYVAAGPLPLPPDLADLVMEITVPPPARRL